MNYKDLYKCAINMTQVDTTRLTWGCELEYVWSPSCEGIFDAAAGGNSNLPASPHVAKITELAESGLVVLESDGSNDELHFQPQATVSQLIDLIASAMRHYVPVVGANSFHKAHTGFHVHVGIPHELKDSLAINRQYENFVYPYCIAKGSLNGLDGREPYERAQWCLPLSYLPVDSKSAAVTWNSSTGGTLEFRMWASSSDVKNLELYLGMTQKLVEFLLMD